MFVLLFIKTVPELLDSEWDVSIFHLTPPDVLIYPVAPSTVLSTDSKTLLSSALVLDNESPVSIFNSMKFLPDYSKTHSPTVSYFFAHTLI